MTRALWFALGAAVGLGVGFGTGYIVVSKAAQAKITGGFGGLLAKIGAPTTVQQMAGRAIGELF